MQQELETASAELGVPRPPVPDLPPSPGWSHRFGQWVKQLIPLLALISFTVVGVGLIIYYPQFGSIKYSFYDWDGGQMIEKFRGLGNYREALFEDKLFWPTFQLVLILLAANAIKMWPSIFTAIVLHRLKSEKLQYLFRVFFVIPLIIPGIVTLLMWKSFFDPQLGPLNKLLTATGLMGVLRHLDVLMPKIAAGLAPVIVYGVEPVFGSVWGMMAVSAVLLTIAGGSSFKNGWPWHLILAGASVLVLGGNTVRLAALLAVAVVTLVMHRQKILSGTILKRVGWTLFFAATVLLLLGMVWTTPTNAFNTDMPAWLSHSKLVIPSLVLWGFPWVGTVGVLIYLAGLQNITQDVYEAAEIDGVGSAGRLFYIELPLIVTQIRINLIFMTIGTLTDYGLVLLLLGPSGGPGGVGMTPGLYMYNVAFGEGRFGYACALGMILAAIILVITVLYQRYLKVEK